MIWSMSGSKLVLRTGSVAASALLLVLGGGCGGDDRADTTSASPASPTRTPEGSTSSTVSPNGRFSVGSYKLFLSCEGTGSPTIVHLHGLGATSDAAAPVADAFAGRQRFCVYDRADMGLSDPAPSRRTGADSARDLHELLGRAKVPPPYVLVGASFGGLIGTVYAARYPREVAGLVLLDATLPGYGRVYRALPARARELMADNLDGNPERIDFFASVREAQDVVGSLPDVPVTYLAAKEAELPPTWPAEKLEPILREQQRAFVDRFSRGRLLLVDAPHGMEQAVPELVAKEIHRIVRSGAG